jgi:hypothetical protein
MRMLSILEGVCLALDPKFRFVQILGNLLEEQGLVEEAYREELKDLVKRVGKAVDTSIDVLPLLKGFLEENYDPTGARREGPSRRRRSGFFPGLGVGLGMAGIAVSIFYLGTFEGKVAFIGSLAVLVLSVVKSR